MCILGEPGQQLWCHQEALEEDPHLHVRLWRVCSCVLICRIHTFKSASGAYSARLKAPALQLKTPKEGHVQEEGFPNSFHIHLLPSHYVGIALLY